MNKLTFITGNANKARAIAKWLDYPIMHQKLDLAEIQSLNLKEVVDHKARQAFAELGAPVLVEDVALELAAFNSFPGPLVKWLVESVDVKGICKMLDGKDRSATVRICYGLCDGDEVQFFEVAKSGTIAQEPRGEGWGFEQIFINDGFDITRAEMDESTHEATSHRKAALDMLSDSLASQ